MSGPARREGDDAALKAAAEAASQVCNLCLEEKPITEFFLRTPTRRAVRCRTCSNRPGLERKRTPEGRAARRAYLKAIKSRPSEIARGRRHALARRLRYPEKEAARLILRNAIRRGEIVRLSACE